MGQTRSVQARGLRTLSFHQPLFDKTFNQYFTRHIRWQVQRQAPNAGKGLGSKVCTIQELLGHADLNMTMIYAHVVNKGCSGRKAQQTCYKHAKKLCAGSPGHQKAGDGINSNSHASFPIGMLSNWEEANILRNRLLPRRKTFRYRQARTFPPPYILFKNVSAGANKWLI